MDELIDNHAERALDLLLQQYKERPVIKTLLTALVEPFQEIEDQLELLKSDRCLDHAKGKQLDHLGESKGESRNGREDANYRRAIYGRIFINNGGGTPDDIISALSFVYSPIRIDYSDLYPAAFHVFVQSKSVLAGIKSFVRSISPVGVNNKIATFTGVGQPFTLSELSTVTVALEIRDSGKTSDLTILDNKFLSVTTEELTTFEDGEGLNEIFIQENYLNLEDTGIYVTDEDSPLRLVASMQDYYIQGGGSLSEAIEND